MPTKRVKGHSVTPGHITDFGFVWGPAEITRICSDEKAGVVLRLETKRETLEMRVTPSGVIRVHKEKKRA